MRITDLLDKRSISLSETPKTKSEALDRIIDLMVASGKINDREAYREQVYAREEESTTGIGEGIAIPHGKCDAVTKPGLAAMVVKDGVEFDALDGQPVTLMFLIAAPNTKDNVHLDVLSKLSVLMMDEVFADALRNAKSADEFLDIIDKADAEQGDIDERLADMNEASANGFKILAVTSCPTGIAHTYMAAEGIEKAAKEKDCFVKIETRGSGGAKNVLTEKEIKEADCIIVAADAQVPMDRFDGKKVIICQVSDGISKAPQLIDQAMSGNVPVYHSGNETSSSTAVSSSGKSGFLGALVAGFAAGYIIVGLKKVCGKLPEAVEKIAPVLLYPVFGILIMGLLMTFAVEPVMGGINTALNAGLSSMSGTSKILLGMIVGGMMSIDMGGPFNKAAYVFGTASIAAGNYDIMAAVMVGGMTAPCAIALATMLFKNKFTKEQRDAGPTNFIMGLAFITEGAIPFAASDPLHVLPACIAGSAVAGALSMAFNCTLMAPHGGIFVFPVVGNPLQYLIALVAGTVVSALLLGVLKKKA